ncbi:RNA-directed DNA polymerase [Streptococcus ruminantium]|uniref:RNA-directed DNA polymerase n=1 Tax=Streptococcus ruminantium TaxID=1917441 RepID=UPI0012DCE7AB|nr:RNA-directed DNA polymerase [Streptococcus ruminantium]
MNKKYLKQEWFLTTEVLPSEVPIFFSNLPLKNNLEKLINLVPTDIENFNKKFNEKYTIPLKYEIPKNNGSYRTISLMHPSSQLKFLFYIMKYEYLLINFLQKSKFNVRKVQKANTITYAESKALDKERLKIEQDFGIIGISTITNEELDRFFKKYFAYNKHYKLSSIINSPSFIRDSLRYRYFSKLDIQNFFGNIYTHSITWAIVGDKHLGKDYSKQSLKNTFAAQSDTIQQKSNDNETNGILVGPEINRIIADIILTHCDYNIEKNLNNQNIQFNKEYKIYRFVDDYYIFSSTYEILETIEQEIVRELSNFNLKLNFEKHQIKEQPFSLSDTPIIQLKQLLNVFSNNREINQLKLLKNNNLEKYQQLEPSYKLSITQILINEPAWIQLYETIRDIVSTTPNSKRRITLYFLKFISLKIYEPIFMGSESTYFFKYLRTIYIALDEINNIYSIHPDSDTTKAYIKILMKFRASLSNLRLIINKNKEEFIKNSENYLSDIENKIFENIYRILKNNSNRINNISDLIVYLKSFDKKLSTQFLCQLLDENPEDYFTLCAIGYYIIGDESRYRVVLKYLFKSILNFIQNYQTHTKSLLEDAKYFYILNDFIHYPGFQKLKIKRKFAKEILQESKNKELDKLGRDSIYYLIFNLLMNQSYYNWNLKQIDFEKLQIQKILTDKNNSSFDDY